MLICSEKMLILAKLRTFWLPIHEQPQKGPSWIGTNSLLHLVMLIYSPIKDIFTVVNKTSVLTTYFFSKRHQDLCFLKVSLQRKRKELFWKADYFLFTGERGGVGIYIFLFLKKMYTRKTFRLSKYKGEKCLDTNNTHDKKFRTQKISPRKRFRPMKTTKMWNREIPTRKI